MPLVTIADIDERLRRARSPRSMDVASRGDTIAA